MKAISIALTLLAVSSGASAQQRQFYDAAGRNAGRAVTDTQGSTTIYDAAGRVTARSSTSGNTTTIYDAAGAKTGTIKRKIQMTKTLTHYDLRHFTGTGQWFRHGLVRGVTYTEGVQYVAEAGGAYWLIDKVATLQLEPAVRAEEFQSWKLKVDDKQAAVLTCEDGNGRVLHSEKIDWTDFPLDQVELWFEGGVILLPSEH